MSDVAGSTAPSVSELVLEFIKRSARTHVSRELLANAELKQYADIVADSLVYELTTFVPGSKETAEWQDSDILGEVPAPGVWNNIKAKLNTWPLIPFALSVQMHATRTSVRHNHTVYNICPHIDIPRGRQTGTAHLTFLRSVPKPERRDP